MRKRYGDTASHGHTRSHAVCESVTVKKHMYYIVLLHCQVIGLYSTITDAVLVHKQLAHSIIQECRLNTETAAGEQLLRPPA
eukprot:COSAG01_NODE_2072_length_8482_cov_27.042049_7_plen_82_part_00